MSPCGSITTMPPHFSVMMPLAMASIIVVLPVPVSPIM